MEKILLSDVKHLLLLQNHCVYALQPLATHKHKIGLRDLEKSVKMKPEILKNSGLKVAFMSHVIGFE